MQPLYKIDRELSQLLEEMEMYAEANDGEFPEELDDQIDKMLLDRNVKIGNICKLIKSLNAEHDMVKNESKNLAERAKLIKNKEDRLKAYLSTSLQGEKYSDNNSKISYRNNKYVYIPSTLDVKEQNDKWIKTSHDWDKTELKNAIKLGEKVPEGIELKINKSIQIK